MNTDALPKDLAKMSEEHAISIQARGERLQAFIDACKPSWRALASDPFRIGKEDWTGLLLINAKRTQVWLLSDGGMIERLIVPNDADNAGTAKNFKTITAIEVAALHDIEPAISKLFDGVTAKLEASRKDEAAMARFPLPRAAG